MQLLFRRENHGVKLKSAKWDLRWLSSNNATRHRHFSPPAAPAVQVPRADRARNPKLQSCLCDLGCSRRGHRVVKRESHLRSVASIEIRRACKLARSTIIREPVASLRNEN